MRRAPVLLFVMLPACAMVKPSIPTRNEAGEISRSHAAKAAFQRTHPCPSTQEHRGKCPGYVIDHIVPLCAGGQDDPINMQWQTIQDAKIKDREEWRQCRELK